MTKSCISVSQGLQRSHLGALTKGGGLAEQLPCLQRNFRQRRGWRGPVILASDPKDLGALADHAQQLIVISAR
jgi:hypothetical protein